MTIFGEVKRFVRRHWPLPDRVTRQMEGGYSLVLHPNEDRWERGLYWKRTYEPATLALMSACLRPGDRMVDVGANIGLMTLHASRAVGSTGSVIALEPHPNTFRRLTANIDLNDCTNVTALNVGAGAEPGLLELFDAPARSSGMASLVAHNHDGTSVGHVDVRRLDDIVPASDARTFVKIDVEGFEHQVLMGAAKTLRAEPVICMECDPSLNAADQTMAAFRLIMETGLFGSYRFRRSKFRNDPTLIAADESHWLNVSHENAIFVPHSLRRELPASLFD